MSSVKKNPTEWDKTHLHEPTALDISGNLTTSSHPRVGFYILYNKVHGCKCIQGTNHTLLDNHQIALIYS